MGHRPDCHPPPLVLAPATIRPVSQENQPSTATGAYALLIGRGRGFFEWDNFHQPGTSSGRGRYVEYLRENFRQPGPSPRNFTSFGLGRGRGSRYGLQSAQEEPDAATRRPGSSGGSSS
jgi:hypothetical protein